MNTKNDMIDHDMSAVSYFPMFINLNQQPVLLIGAGKAAALKLRKLQEFHADVTLVSREISPEFLADLSEASGSTQVSDHDSSGVPASQIHDVLTKDELKREAKELLCAAKPDSPVHWIFSEDFCDGFRDHQALEKKLESFLLVVNASGDDELDHLLADLCARKRIFYNAVDRRELCTFIFGSTISRGPLSIGISTAGASPSAAIDLKKRIAAAIPNWMGSLLEQLANLRPLILQAGLPEKERSALFKQLFACGQTSQATLNAQQIRTIFSRYGIDEAILDAGLRLADPVDMQENSTAASGVIASADCKKYDDQADLSGNSTLPLVSSSPSQQENKPSNGKVYLAGAGCGSKDWLTCKTRDLLKSCDVLVYDALVDDSIIGLFEGSEKIAVGKRKGKHSASQKEINELLIALAKQDKQVLRLKGGDPFVFGRGMEEVEALRAHHLAYELIPGISSALAVPLRMEIPVTDRLAAPGFMVITAARKAGMENAEYGWKAQLPAMAAFDGSIVVLMGMAHAAEICRDLMAAGKPADTPAALICSPTISESQMVSGTLESLPELLKDLSLKPPGILLISKTILYASDQMSDRRQESEHQESGHFKCGLLLPKQQAGKTKPFMGEETQPTKQKEIQLAVHHDQSCCPSDRLVIATVGTRELHDKVEKALQIIWHSDPLQADRAARHADSRSLPHDIDTSHSESDSFAEVISLMETRIVPLKHQMTEEWKKHKPAVLVLSSPRAADLFLSDWQDKRMDVRNLAGTQIVCAGNTTAARLEKAGIFADMIAPCQCLSELKDALGKQAESSGGRPYLFLLRSQAGSTDLDQALSRAYTVHRFDVYKPEYTFEPSEGLPAAANYVLFGSYESIRSFLAHDPEYFSRTDAVPVVLSKYSARAFEQTGIKPLTAREVSASALAQCAVNDWKARQQKAV